MNRWLTFEETIAELRLNGHWWAQLTRAIQLGLVEWHREAAKPHVALYRIVEGHTPETVRAVLALVHA